METEFPNEKITIVPGTQFLRNEGNPVPDKLLTTARWQTWSQSRVQPLAGDRTGPRSEAGGGQMDTAVPVLTGHFRVEGQVHLPE
jgi:hypothetical protein